MISNSATVFKNTTIYYDPSKGTVTTEHPTVKIDTLSP